MAAEIKIEELVIDQDLKKKITLIDKIMRSVKFTGKRITSEQIEYLRGNPFVLKYYDSTTKVDPGEEKKRKELKSKAGKEVDLVLTGSTPDGFDLSDLIVNRKLCSLRHRVEQDLDIMYSYKNYIVYEEFEKKNNPVLVRYPSTSHPGFSKIRKIGLLQGNIMEDALDKCTDEERFLSSEKIMKMTDLNIPHEEDSLATGPALNLDYPGGIDFVNIDLRSEQGLSDLMLILTSIKERKDRNQKVGESISQVSSAVDFSKHPTAMKSVDEVPLGEDYEANISACTKELKLDGACGNKETVTRNVDDEKYEERYKSYDMVNAFPLNTWPSEANEFFTRKRSVEWPSKEILDVLKGTQCYVVCVGSHLSPKDTSLKEREFRLSFSKAETVLANSLSETQHQCYRWAKLMLKLHLSSPKILSSYHLKTMFFWFCETVSVVQFRSNLGEVLLQFFMLILNACKNQEIPNYFIPSNNMIQHHPKKDVEVFISSLGNFINSITEKMSLIYSNQIVHTCTKTEVLTHIRLRLSSGIFIDEEAYWKYILEDLAENAHEFSDEDTENLHRAAQNYGQVFPSFLKESLHLS